jgi:hypothetical protein
MNVGIKFHKKTTTATQAIVVFLMTSINGAYHFLPTTTMKRRLT